MNGLNGKTVSLDLDALNQLCGKCLHDLEELEQQLTRTEEESYTRLPVQLLARQATRTRAAAQLHYA